MTSGQRVTMLIYPADKEFIRNSTLNYPNIETGGDLFGLWQSESEVVVQLATGPGQNCHRTQTAFFQDKTYLSQVGGYLTTAKGLCNIGEWHSHHRLNLPEPSAGDRATVWRNMPGCGLKRFLLVIATITPTRQVNINGFMFTAPENGRSHGGMEHVQTRVLNGPNPFRKHDEVLSVLREGKEVAPSGQDALDDENDETPSIGSQKPRRGNSVLNVLKGKNSGKYKIKKPKKQKKQKNAKKNDSQLNEKPIKRKKKFPFSFGKKKDYKELPDNGATSGDFSQSDFQSDPPAPEVSTQSSNNIDAHYNGQTTQQPTPSHPQTNRTNAQRHASYV
ncbi:Hypothetical predicted protein [Paramuricea clavata]|uniref:Uncharacterized protein n=1 Tax=Paramuricea clavata TaxID=317549 RepID=A0A6S7JDK9_PARCT|nr:Hypothetical predicted protein [Paramuricea clavata]